MESFLFNVNPFGCVFLTMFYTICDLTATRNGHIFLEKMKKYILYILLYIVLLGVTLLERNVLIQICLQSQCLLLLFYKQIKTQTTCYQTTSPCQ